MKISETIERECCTRADLIPYNGTNFHVTHLARLKYMFCRHCGCIWGTERRMDEAGSMSPVSIVVQLKELSQ